MKKFLTSLAAVIASATAFAVLAQAPAAAETGRYGVITNLPTAELVSTYTEMISFNTTFLMDVALVFMPSTGPIDQDDITTPIYFSDDEMEKLRGESLFAPLTWLQLAAIRRVQLVHADGTPHGINTLPLLARRACFAGFAMGEASKGYHVALKTTDFDVSIKMATADSDGSAHATQTIEQAFRNGYKDLDICMTGNFG